MVRTISVRTISVCMLAAIGLLQMDPAWAQGGGASLSADWRADKPGNVHHITVGDLPKPFATETPRNRVEVVPKPAGAQLTVPAGFEITQFASGLQGPRLMRVAPNGDIFVSESLAGKVVVLRPAADGRSATQTSVFASGLNRPFGIAFYPRNDPQWVYVANTGSVVRYPYRSGDLEARGAAEVIVPSLPTSDRPHWTRDVVFSQDGARMFVSVGSSSNVADTMPKLEAAELQAWIAQNPLGAAWGPERERADVLVFDPSGKNRRIYATGIRNCVGMAIHPTTSDLWCSTNERDLLGDGLPPDYITRVREGAFYGWPWYYLGGHEDPRLVGARPDLADKVTVPDVLLQAHVASLQMVFYDGAQFPAEYRGDAFAALHGSWNRSKRVGYKIIRVKTKDGVPTGEFEDFVTGFVVDDASTWGRPVGVAVAKDGALLFSEDGNGTIWRVARAARETSR